MSWLRNMAGLAGRLVGKPGGQAQGLAGPARAVVARFGIEFYRLDGQSVAISARIGGLHCGLVLMAAEGKVSFSVASAAPAEEPLSQSCGSRQGGEE